MGCEGQENFVPLQWLGSRALVSRLTCMGHHLLEQLLSYLLLVFSDFLSIFATFIARRDIFFCVG